MADGMKEFHLTVNQDFAKKLHKEKEKAEFDRLKQKFGDEDFDNRSESSSSSESEDEDARELTTQKENDFLTVLSMIKNKDPKIYEKDSSLYHDDQEKSSSEEERENNSKAKKPMYLKDYERNELLQRGSLAFLSDEESDNESSEGKTVQNRGSPTYVEEQKLIKESFQKAIEENDNDDDDFLKIREKTIQEKLQEESKYVEWLKGENVKLGTTPSSQMEALRRYWMDPELDKDEQFLRDYILERNYVEKDLERIPTYDEIVKDDEEDEKDVEEQEEFERKFNFRFEEPDAEFIKTYPRTIQGSVRKTDERRKEKRKKRESRKEKEREEKREELKRLKKLKRKEIMEKLEKLKEITGNPNVGFKEEDIEGDFDPQHYDDAMKKVFDEQFYAGDEHEKPEFDDDLGDEENWDDWRGEFDENMYNGQDMDDNYEPHVEDPDFNMDADYEENLRNQNIAGFPKKKRRRPSRFALALAKKKPVFDPDEKTFEEYFDEYYKLDYEDIISDIPCRFKYRQVVPNDFGLTTDEILSCPDKELNQWVSVKKMSQYRPNTDEMKDLKKYRKRGRNAKLKKRILTSLAEQERAQEDNNRRKSYKKTSDHLPLTEEITGNSSNHIEIESANQGTVTRNVKETKKSISTANTKRSEALKEQKRLVSKEQTSQRSKGQWKERKGKRNGLKQRHVTFNEMKEQAMKKRLQRQFRGAKKEHLNKLSAARLASYGLLKTKKKK